MIAEKSTIGILALQGAVREHQRALELAGASSTLIKQPQDLESVDGLVIPGGESTAIGKLMRTYGFIEAIRERAAAGMVVFGTCAGLILLSRATVEGSDNLLGLMNIEVKRNAFGRQVDSFETGLTVGELGVAPFNAIFIRAPWVESVGAEVKVLAEHDGRPVLVEENHFLAAAFHPELTDDFRLHKYFLHKVKGRAAGSLRSAKNR